MNTAIDSIDVSKILFLDIETVPQYSKESELSDVERTLWVKKSERLAKEDESPDELYKKAGIFSEFGKIVCISVGFLRPVDGFVELRIRSVAGRCRIAHRVCQECND